MPRPGLQLRAAVAEAIDAAHGYQAEGFASGVRCVLLFAKEARCGTAKGVIACATAPGCF